jgi:riboflavin synthase
MFTGLVEACVPVVRREARGEGLRIGVALPDAAWRVEPGDSVSVCGACLTAVDIGESAPSARGSVHEIAFDLTAETLRRTWFASLEPGVRVNLERAMRLDERLDGHLVAGHVDGRAELVAIEDSRDGGAEMRFEVESGLERYLIDKGSITLDGISLTVVEPRARSFRVALIPSTLTRTNLSDARAGQIFNVEVDLIGKWIERLLPR